jgi:hypothetical protein
MGFRGHLHPVADEIRGGASAPPISFVAHQVAARRCLHRWAPPPPPAGNRAAAVESIVTPGRTAPALVSALDLPARSARPICGCSYWGAVRPVESAALP